MPSLPLPFSQRPASEWVDQLQTATNPEDRLKALQAIGSMAGPNEIFQWAAQSLDDTDSTIRAFAATLLGRVGLPPSDQAETQLVSLLPDSDPDVRFEVSRALIRTRSTRASQAVAVLMPFLDEPETNPLMLATVINLLTDIELDSDFVNRQVRPRLLRWLEHDRGEVREAISMAFAKWPMLVGGCSDRIVPLFDDPEPVVRENIAKAFGKAGISDETVLAGLRSLCDDEDAEVARIAAESMQTILGRGN
jgi:HEAT repeat protein